MAGPRVVINQATARQVAMDAVRPLIDQVAGGVQRRATAFGPHRTGHLTSTWRITIGPSAQGITGTVEFFAEYAAAVNNGRRALTIRPTKKKALRFQIGGRVIYAKVVHQPARPKDPFLTDALADVAGAAGFRVIRKDHR